MSRKLENVRGTNTFVNRPGEDNTVRFWDWRVESQLYSIEKDLGQRNQWPIVGYAMTPDESRIVIASNRGNSNFGDPTVTVWSMSDRRRLNYFPLADTAALLNPWFNKDGTQVYAFRGNCNLQILDTKSNKELKTIKLDKSAAADTLTVITISPDGTIAVGGKKDGRLAIWSLPDGKPIGNLLGHNNAVRSIAFSSDGKRVLSTSQDSTARIWDLENKREICYFTDSDPLLAGVFVGENLIATGGTSKAAILWDTETLKPLMRFEKHTDTIRSLAVSADGKYLATGGHDGLACVWELPSTATTPAAPSGRQTGDGFVPLFNGKDLSGWHKIRMSDCEYICNGNQLTATGKTFWLASDKAYSDFALKFEFPWKAEANRSLLFRTKLDYGPDAKTGNLTSHRVSLGIKRPADGVSIPPGSFAKTANFWGSPRSINWTNATDPGVIREGEWCQFELTANGPRIVVKINGKTVTDFEDKELPLKTGEIHFNGLNELQVRNVYIKPLN